MDSETSENKNFSVNKRNKPLTKHELDELSKEELIEKIIQLQAHNTQLRNILQKRDQEGKLVEEGTSKKKKRKFDFSKSHRRHILLKFLYLGWDYQGYASQEDSTSTIEYHLFRALEKTCLIASRESANYHRCGRTDKGVSAFAQTISLDIRSKFPPEEQNTPESIANELDYCIMLNQNLPDDIRCISWHPIEDTTFSARFNCRQRIYRYFFPRGRLNIAAMEKGCSHLIGSHDFRNFCKMDVANGVVSFTRTVENAQICNIDERDDDPHGMLFLEIRSNAFLWHQIRCIMSILLLIGLEKEHPEVICELLDVVKNPQKPQYSLALDIPLNLYETVFEETNKWVYNQHTMHRVIRNLEEQWVISNIKTTMMRQMSQDLRKIYEEKFPGNLDDTICSGEELIQGAKMKNYRSLMERTKAESLEQRIEHFVKKRRLNVM